MRLPIFTTFVCLLITMAPLNAAAQKKPAGAAAQKRSAGAPNAFTSPFRYVIVYSKVEPQEGEDDVPRTFVEVLLEPEAFTRANLRKLFDLLQARFPDAQAMEISVYTDLNDIETPEERDEPRISDANWGPDLPNLKNNALISSFNGKRSILMSFANGRTKDFTF
ncbi:MAG: hypothetical protein UZ17_ACD001001881 [Acidobacteria bacterium OLB17]|nr:MAG: hypothetical protein UZ17_ACD001001881 [Acidobacteria bacterium OLB17]